MIVYNNDPFTILFQRSGSVLPHCLPVGIFSFLIGLCLALLRKYDSTDDVFGGAGKLIANSFSIQTVAVVIGYLLVIRTNIALNRWMHSIGEVQLMLSKWGDAFDALSGFFAGRGAKATLEERERILNFRIRIAHWFSLMSCLAFFTLRNNGKLQTLHDVPIKEMFPPVPGMKHTKSFTMGMTRTTSSGVRLEKRLACAAAVAAGQGFQSEKSVDLVEGIDLLVLASPTPEEVQLLNMVNDKVNTLGLWIIQAIVLEIRAGTLDTPPPIVSRVFQEISSGMLGYNQALKFALVPFPFPFAQMISLIMLIVYIGLPFYIDEFTQNVVVTPVMCFLLPLCYCGLNRIAIELEEPFGVDDNDVDIEVRHEEFLWMLVDVLRQPDVSPISPDHQVEYKILKGCICNVDKEVLPEELHPFSWSSQREPSRRTAGSETNS